MRWQYVYRTPIWPTTKSTSWKALTVCRSRRAWQWKLGAPDPKRHVLGGHVDADRHGRGGDTPATANGNSQCGTSFGTQVIAGDVIVCGCTVLRGTAP